MAMFLDPEYVPKGMYRHLDFEFDNRAEIDSFEMPDFCLADVTDDIFIAGFRLSGKCYEDIEDDLARFGYRKLSVD